ncbi:MAG TPA: inorganic diphosphatase [Candidatus Sulfotelmatobacter sp.]
MSRNGRSVLADPSRLKPIDEDEDDLFHVIIETPKGSRNKYAFDQKQKIFCLKKVLPAGMAFPYDFGFLPSTRGDDGDPLDVLVLMDEPAFPGCLLKCRLIGVIEGEQESKKKKERNDRIIAIEHGNHAWAEIHSLQDLGDHFCRELEEFFVDYHKLSEETYRILNAKGAKAARRLIKMGMKKA